MPCPPSRGNAQGRSSTHATTLILEREVGEGVRNGVNSSIRSPMQSNRERVAINTFETAKALFSRDAAARPPVGRGSPPPAGARASRSTSRWLHLVAWQFAPGAAKAPAQGKTRVSRLASFGSQSLWRATPPAVEVRRSAGAGASSGEMPAPSAGKQRSNLTDRSSDLLTVAARVDPDGEPLSSWIGQCSQALSLICRRR
jgi:hypothetical protein